MTAHRLIVQVDSKNGILLQNLPFKAGQRVEVIVLPEENSASSEDKKNNFSLYGTLLKYDQPFDSATDSSDWEALK